MRQQQDYVDLSPRARSIVRSMAGQWADLYLAESLLPELEEALDARDATLRDVREAFMDPCRCLKGFYAHYAFARRGKDRLEFGRMAVEAFERVVNEQGFDALIRSEDGDAVWRTFCDVCDERHRKNPEQLNRGIMAGMVELAQEIYQLDAQGSIAGWILSGVLQTSKVESQFLRIVDVRGVGPKTTSTFLRDVVCVFGIEDQVDNIDRLYFQPIDRWIRLVAREVIPDVNVDETVDWVLAGKISKYSRKSGVSGIRFNMGASHFGHKEVRDSGRFDQVIEDHFPAGLDRMAVDY